MVKSPWVGRVVMDNCVLQGTSYGDVASGFVYPLLNLKDATQTVREKSILAEEKLNSVVSKLSAGGFGCDQYIEFDYKDNLLYCIRLLSFCEKIQKVLFSGSIECHSWYHADSEIIIKDGVVI